MHFHCELERVTLASRIEHTKKEEGKNIQRFPYTNDTLNIQTLKYCYNFHYGKWFDREKWSKVRTCNRRF